MAGERDAEKSSTLTASEVRDAQPGAGASDSLAAGTLTDDAASAVPRQVPPGTSIPLPSIPSEFYELQAEVGRGGVGVVLKARDRRLGRAVALKRLQRADGIARLRFEREMRITAKLQHPGVVPIHEAGVLPSGEPFYAMKLVEGRSLKELIEERKTLEERLQLLPNLLAVAETIAYAHSQGIIHRDIKPSNIIVGAYGETVVIDWGLAKDLRDKDDDAIPAGPYRSADQGGMTMTGQVIGTPAYMPPEQARGEEVDERADVYALGAVLRQLITGEAPYSARTSAEVLHALLTREPLRVEMLAPSAPRDLTAIVSKAMARSQMERYPSARFLVADVHAFLNGRLVSAYRYGAHERLSRWIARRRAIVVTLILAVVALIALGVTSLNRIQRERDQALRSEASARAANEEATLRTSALVREQAARELDRGDSYSALRFLADYPPNAGDLRPLYPLVKQALGMGVPAFTIEPAFQVLAAGADVGSETVAVADGRSLQVFAMADGRELALVQYLPSGQGRPLAIVPIRTSSPESVTWLIASTDGNLVSVELGPRPPVVSTSRPCHEHGLTAIAVAAEADSIGVACTDGVIALIEAEKPVSPVVLGHNASRVFSLTFLDGLGPLVAADTEGFVRYWDISNKSSQVLLREREGLTSMANSPHCGRLLVGTATGAVLAIDGSTRHILKYTTNDANASIHLDLSPDCTRLASLSSGNRVTIIDLTSRSPLYIQPASSIAWTGETELLIGGPDGSLTYHETETGWVETRASGADQIDDIALLPSGRFAAIGTNIFVWPSPSEAELIPLSAPAATLATNATESQLLVGGRDGSLMRLDGTGHSRLPFEHAGEAIVRLGPADTMFSAGTIDGCVVRHGTTSTEPHEVLFCVAGGIIDYQFTPDQRAVVAVSPRGLMIRHELETQSTTMHSAPLRAYRLWPGRNGSEIILTSMDGDIVAFDGALDPLWHHDLGDDPVVAAIPTRETEAILLIAADGGIEELGEGGTTTRRGGCGGGVARVWLSPDGRQLAVPCMNGEVVVIPLDRELARQLGHTDPVIDVDRSIKPGLWASASRSGTISVISTGESYLQVLRGSPLMTNVEIVDELGLVVAATNKAVLATWRLGHASLPTNDIALMPWLMHFRR